MSSAALHHVGGRVPALPLILGHQSARVVEGASTGGPPSHRPARVSAADAGLSLRLHRFYGAGELLVGELISRRHALDRSNEGYADLLKGGPKRGVLVCD